MDGRIDAAAVDTVMPAADMAIAAAEIVTDMAKGYCEAEAEVAVHGVGSSVDETQR